MKIKGKSSLRATNRRAKFIHATSSTMGQIMREKCRTRHAAQAGPGSPSTIPRLDPRPGGGGGYKKRTEENKATGDSWAECWRHRYPT